jgi:hypothetical protein
VLLGALNKESGDVFQRRVVDSKYEVLVPLYVSTGKLPTFMAASDKSSFAFRVADIISNSDQDLRSAFEKGSQVSGSSVGSLGGEKRG